MPYLSNIQSPKHRNVSKGFSLLELLVVIACMCILLGLAVPAFSHFGRAVNTSKSINDVVGLLEFARTYAKASNARVQIGFYSDASGLKVAVISGREIDKFTAITPIRRFPEVRLAVAPTTNRPAADMNLAEASGNVLDAFNMPGQIFDRVIEFNTRGGARVLKDGLVRRIEIGLLPNLNGITPSGMTNQFGAVQINGLSGIVEVFRL